MFSNPRRSIERVSNALVGHDVLLVEPPPRITGPHTISVDLVGQRGDVFARKSYVD